MCHAKYNHHTGTYAWLQCYTNKTSWHEYSEEVRIHMINSRVICRNHAKELQFRALCWNLNVPYNIYSANESYELLSCAYHLDRLQE